ncbi:MAG: hypothetical protein JWR21_104 [Herminiimonas sp.]|nr:hypothetical protein [Herminiimonas sp.]MDB5854537.1 hypothetical protein [Herminiimonas sp.]
MGKLALGFLVAMLAGCSGMGMGMGSGQSSSSGSSASSGAMNAGDESNINYNSASQQTVIDPRTGRLTLYHGG